MFVRSCSVAALAVVLAACATGVTPPSPTPMASLSPAGPFLFGMGELGCNVPQSAAACDKDDKFEPGAPTALVSVPPFAIDVHEVTNEQYRYCVAMERCSLPAGDNGPAGISDYHTNAIYNNHPVVMVRWGQAAEYCRFLGRRLPTEFEWELAAGGQASTVDGKKVYPWATPGYQAPLADGACDKNVNIARCNSGLKSTRPVMTSKDDVTVVGGVAIHDLVGNVSELTASDWVENLGCDANQPYDCQDCKACLLKAKTAEDKKACGCLTCVCGNDSTPQSKPNCYQPCQNPTCAKPLAGAPPLSGAYTGKNLAARRMVRGGSFYDYGNNEKKLRCDGRSDTRSLFAEPTGDPLTHLGFRCARSL